MRRTLNSLPFQPQPAMSPALMAQLFEQHGTKPRSEDLPISDKPIMTLEEYYIALKRTPKTRRRRNERFAAACAALLRATGPAEQRYESGLRKQHVEFQMPHTYSVLATIPEEEGDTRSDLASKIAAEESSSKGQSLPQPERALVSLGADCDGRQRDEAEPMDVQYSQCHELSASACATCSSGRSTNHKAATEQSMPQDDPLPELYGHFTEEDRALLELVDHDHSESESSATSLLAKSVSSRIDAADESEKGNSKRRKRTSKRGRFDYPSHKKRRLPLGELQLATNDVLVDYDASPEHSSASDNDPIEDDDSENRVRRNLQPQRKRPWKSGEAKSLTDIRASFRLPKTSTPSSNSRLPVTPKRKAHATPRTGPTILEGDGFAGDELTLPNVGRKRTPAAAVNMTPRLELSMHLQGDIFISPGSTAACSAPFSSLPPLDYSQLEAFDRDEIEDSQQFVRPVLEKLEVLRVSTLRIPDNNVRASPKKSAQRSITSARGQLPRRTITIDSEMRHLLSSIAAPLYSDEEALPEEDDDSVGSGGDIGPSDVDVQSHRVSSAGFHHGDNRKNLSNNDAASDFDYTMSVVDQRDEVIDRDEIMSIDDSENDISTRFRNLIEPMDDIEDDEEGVAWSGGQSLVFQHTSNEAAPRFTGQSLHGATLFTNSIQIPNELAHSPGLHKCTNSQMQDICRRASRNLTRVIGHDVSTDDLGFNNDHNTVYSRLITCAMPSSTARRSSQPTDPTPGLQKTTLDSDSLRRVTPVPSGNHFLPFDGK